MHTDELSRKASAKSISVRGVAIPVALGGVHCHSCQAFGHYKRDCPKQQSGKRRAKEQKHRWTGKGGDPSPKWCSYHNTKTHSDEECIKQQAMKAEKPAQPNFANIGSAHLAQADESEPSAFGVSFEGVGASAALARLSGLHNLRRLGRLSLCLGHLPRKC